MHLGAGSAGEHSGEQPDGSRTEHQCPVAGREGWVEAWVRIGSLDAAALDMLALGAEAEVIHPPELRALVGQLARRIADLHAGAESPW